MKTRLLIKPDNSGWTDIDLYEDISIPITFQVSDVKDLSKKNTSFSKSFEVPCTENNMQLLKGKNITELSGNVQFGKKYPCKVLHDGIDVITGVVRLEKINKEDNIPVSYTLQINSNVKSFIDTINDLTFEDIDWTGLVVDSSDMSPVNIANIWYGLDWDVQFDRGIGVALIDRINNIGSQVDYWRTKDLSPFIYANKILDKIITQAGYKWESMFFRHHFDGTWDTFNNWIVGTFSIDGNYVPREVRNVGEFDSRQFVIPSQTDPNNWEWNKIIPSNQIVDTYITRRDSDSDDEQRYVSKSSTTQPVPAMEGETTSNTFFSTDSSTNTYYKLPKVKADGSVDETAGLHNYVYVATLPGWYELSFDFDWKYELAQFRKVRYDSNVPAWDGAVPLTAGEKIVVEEPDQLFYKVEFNAQVCNPNDTVRKSYRLYTLENNGNGVKWFKGDGSNKNKITMEPLNDYGNGLSFSSTEYEEYNNEEETTMVAVNGYEFGRPVNRKLTVYLYAGDKVRLQSRCTAYSGYVEEDSNHLWEFNFRKSNTLNHYVPYRGSVWVSSRPERKFFDAKLVDKIGPYRTLDPSLFYDVKIKQTDFFNSLVKMFNLYIEDVSFKKIHEDGTDIFPNNTIRIEPRPIYYNIGKYNWESNVINEKYARKIVDFTEYVDFSTISYKRPDDYLYTNLVFKMKDDTSDYFSKMYKDKTLSTFGELNVKAIYTSTESDDDVDMIFSNTTNGSSSCQHDPEFNVAIPCIFSLNDRGELNTGYKSEMRLLNKYTVTRRTPKVYYDSSSYLSGGNGTPILSVFDDETTYLDPEYIYGYNRLEFGTREYYLEKFTEPNNPKISNTDLFNAFYLNEYSQITADDARLLSCKCHIPSNVINDLKLSHSILIDGIIYYINKISNWVSENELCDCEFLKFEPYAFYDYYIDNPTPSDFSLQTIGVTSSTDSAGNTTVNSNTTNYTVVNNYSSGTGDDYSISGQNGDVTLYKNSQIDSVAQLPTFAGSNRGYVPQSTGDADKYLCADGSWKTVNSGKEYSLDSTDGISVSLYEDNVLKDRVPLDIFLGADAQNAGTPGFVPQVAPADRFKFLRGDGTWANGSGGNTYSIQNSITTPSTIQLLENGVVSSEANVPEYEGCTQQYPGEYGMIHPAPAGGMDWYFGGDAQWRPIPSGGYVLRFSLHSGVYALDSGNYSGAVSALRQNKPVFAILRDKDVTQDGDEIVYTLSHYYDDDSSILFSKKESSSSDDYVELYDDDSFYFYSTPIRNFGKLKVDSNTTYQSLTPNSTLTLNSGTGITLSQSNAAVTFNLKTASSSEIGGIKVSSTTAQSAGTIATSGMRRPVQVDANGNASVLCDSHVAGAGLSLINNAFTLNQATSSVLGGILVSSTSLNVTDTPASSGEIYPVQLSGSGLAGVRVPEYEATLPAKMVDKNIGVCPSDATETSYRVGSGFCDIYGKEYTKYAGTVTPVSSIYIDGDSDGRTALKEWELFTSLEDYTGRVILSYPNSRTDDLFALPVTIIRTERGSVPVVLVNNEIMQLLGRAYSTGPNKLDCVPFPVS